MQLYKTYRYLNVLGHGSEKMPLEAMREHLFFPSHLQQKKEIKPPINNLTDLLWMVGAVVLHLDGFWAFRISLKCVIHVECVHILLAHSRISGDCLGVWGIAVSFSKLRSRSSRRARTAVSSAVVSTANAYDSPRILNKTNPQLNKWIFLGWKKEVTNDDLWHSTLAINTNTTFSKKDTNTHHMSECYSHVHRSH